MVLLLTVLLLEKVEPLGEVLENPGNLLLTRLDIAAVIYVAAGIGTLARLRKGVLVAAGVDGSGELLICVWMTAAEEGSTHILNS